MDSRNLLIFTVYFIVVVYVLYQAYKSLDNQVVIQFDSEDLNRQLDDQGLKGVIQIKFKFKDSYKLDELTKLPISIKNISNEETIRVDWDQSSIRNFDNVIDRVVRLTPGLAEIPQKQVESIIVPGREIKEELSDDKSITGSLFKPMKLKKATAKSDPFFLRLFFTISDLTGSKRPHTLLCRFIPKKLRWTKALTIALKPKKPN